MQKIIPLTVTLLALAACRNNPEQTKSVAASGNTGFYPADITMSGELPSKEAIPALFDEMDYQQAVQCYLWALPMVEIEAMKEVQEQTFGATDNDLVVYTSYEDKLGIITGNATTPYIMAFMDLSKTGPFVIEVPAGAIAGGVSDCWQRSVLSIGEMGKAEGKYLLIPPGQAPVKDAGYNSTVCSTMTLWLGLRALDPDPAKALAIIRGVKMYPYAARKETPTTRVITPQGRRYKAIQPTGLRYFEMLHTILQREPVEERDRFFVAWLDNLGVKKGQAFNPTEKQKNILIAAAQRGQLIAIANSFKKRFEHSRHWPDRQWEYVLIMKDPMQRAANFDEFYERAAYFYEAAGYSKTMISKTPDVGQAYLATYADKNGDWLAGAQNYTLHIPGNPPAINFWSITVYDAATRCLIDNPQHNADLSSRKDLMKNSDGSVDLYFGPKVQQGKERNWIQTIEGKHWFVYFRLYGPTTAYFDKSWKAGDIEQIKQQGR